MIIGIICSHIREGKEILKAVRNLQEKEANGLNLWEGFFKDHRLILATNVFGKDLASLATSFLIKEIKVEIVINCGGAGAINPKRKIKDIIIGNNFIKYDSFSKDTFQVIKKSFLNLVNKFKELTTSYHDHKICEGLIVSGNENVENFSLKNTLWKKHQAECVDWESATVAKISIQNKIPFLILRGISDQAKENFKEEFYQNIDKVAKIYSKLFLKFLSKLT
ncbi:MAG: 5'-methylthioadenosine/S-adenosylhomocysteine nucleosidase [bacterium]|nr:5'-methylthioadenosine/S-adenosylhomocysteine nucleosidase [bacterium]